VSKHAEGGWEEKTFIDHRLFLSSTTVPQLSRRWPCTAVEVVAAVAATEAVVVVVEVAVVVVVTEAAVVTVVVVVVVAMEVDMARPLLPSWWPFDMITDARPTLLQQVVVVVPVGKHLTVHAFPKVCPPS
jgi:hypothetical protein